MKSSINSRINSLINALRMNKNSFGKFIEMSPQSIHHILGERQSKPSSEMLEKIIRSVNNLESTKKLNSDWLLVGEGEMFIDSKPADQGAFGSQVEELVKRLDEKDRQLLEKDRFIQELLKQVGKDEVIGLVAAVILLVTGSVTYQPAKVKTIALR